MAGDKTVIGFVRRVGAWAHPQRHPLRLLLVVAVLHLGKLWWVWQVPNPNLLMPHRFSVTDGWLDWDDVSIFRLLHEDHRLYTVLGWFHGDWVHRNGYYRPLAATSLWLDYLLWRHRHRGYALTAWVLQGLVGWLLALSVFYLFRDAVLSLLTAGAFAVCWMPSSRVVVQHLSTRIDGLCAVGMLASLVLALRFGETGRWWQWGASCLMAVLALLSKEMAATLPLLVLWSAVVSGRLSSQGKRVALTVVGLGSLVLVWWWAYRQFIPTAPLRLALLRPDRLVGQYSLAFADTLPTAWFFWRWVTAFNHPAQLLMAESWRRLIPFLVTAIGLFLVAERLPALLLFWLGWVLISWLPLLVVRLMNPHYGYIPSLYTYALIGGAIGALGEVAGARSRHRSA